MPTKKRTPFQLQSKVRSLTGGERERCKARTGWVLALSRSDTQTLRERLLADPSLASTPCHLTGLSPVHWAVRRNNRQLLSLLIKEFRVSPNTRSRAGLTPLHLAAIYNRREIYQDLLALHGADPSMVDYSGTTAAAYLENVLGYGSNNKGINKMWQDLAMDIQSYQKKCFDEEQKYQKNYRQQEQKCFEGMKKRHSIAF